MKTRYVSLLLTFLFALSLTGCAFWQKQENKETPNYTYLEAFISKDQAKDMLQTEPLKSQLQQLLKDKSEVFMLSRQQLKPVSQVMQGYILSEGQSNDYKMRSLVIVDPYRSLLMVVLVDVGIRKIDILRKPSNKNQQEASAEMKAYAQNWSLGQFGKAQ